MFSRYVAHVFSERFWNSPSRPYYYWFIIIIIIKLRSRFTDPERCVEEWRNANKTVVEKNWTVVVTCKDLGIDERIILKWIFRGSCGRTELWFIWVKGGGRVVSFCECGNEQLMLSVPGRLSASRSELSFVSFFFVRFSQQTAVVCKQLQRIGLCNAEAACSSWGSLKTQI